MRSEEVGRIRTKLGLSQSQFARKLGVSLSAVCRWEMGFSHPHTNNVRSIRELAGGKGATRELIVTIQGGVMQAVHATMPCKVHLMDWDNAACDGKDARTCKALEKRIKQEQMEMVWP